MDPILKKLIAVFYCITFCFFCATAYAKDKESSSPINISSEELRVFKQKNIAIFDGKVHAIQDDLNLYCDSMTVFFEKNQTQNSTKDQENGVGKSKVEKVNFSGNVHIVTREESAKSQVGEYNVKTGIFTLTGNVELIQKKNTLYGNKLIYNKNTGESLLTNSTSGKVKKQERVRAILIPEESSDKKARD